MKKYAVIVVDMLNDFVTGPMASPRVKTIIEPIRELCAKARKQGIPIIYTNDSHTPELDTEFKLWGPHAVEGTKGAKVIAELKPKKGDIIIPKGSQADSLYAHHAEVDCRCERAEYHAALDKQFAIENCSCLGAVGGVLADQWKEFFYCEAMDKDVLVVKGRKVDAKTSNTKGSDNVITNGSGIVVADGQCMIIVEQGKVVDLCAEPGEYKLTSFIPYTIKYANTITLF